ncbi:MAG: D-alanyl-D-alanine carboxypeptidase/D-alanyl-D-alanine-endopeptidase [Planctomycetota bacterium]
MKRLAGALVLLGAVAVSPVATIGEEPNRTIDAAVAKIGKGAKVSILIRSVTTGETLYEKDAHEARTPASTMKLATTAAALTLLGADFQHETAVYARGTLGADGTLKGDLVVRGSGDPSISRRFLIDDSKELLADWAEEIKKKVRVVEGDIVADDRAFERLGFHPDWNPKEAQDWYAAEVSALNLNDNCVDIEVHAQGGAVRATARPETKAHTLDVKATTTTQKREHAVGYSRDGDGRVFHVTGKVWTQASPFEAPVTVASPARFFADVLADRLKEAGVTVRGKSRLVEASEPQPTGTPIHVHKGPLPRALTVCNKRSQNLYAECLLKTLGLKKGAAGSWEEGAKVVQKFLSDLKVAEGEARVRDGSGLSREDRLSATALVAVLEAAAKGPHATTFDESLSIAGVDGTLEKRLKDLPKGSAFHGKTGTMHGVSSLAGYIELERGAKGEREVIALAVIVNGTNGAALARQAQDDAVRLTIRNRSTTGAKTGAGEHP